MKKSKSTLFWENLGMNALRFLKFTVLELVDGIMNEKIRIGLAIYFGTFMALFFVLRVDSQIAELSGRSYVELPFWLRQFVVYTLLLSGWIQWAGVRAYHRMKVLARLREAFLYCGLEINGKLPALIEDSSIDRHVRKLKLFTQGLSLKKFNDCKENLEAFLNISILKIHDENGDKGRVNILYAMKALGTSAILEPLQTFRDGEIPIGISHEGPVSVNIRDVSHILVAGQTNGGKSNFVKVVASVLTVNNEEAEIYFLDFKGGMESADLTNRLGAEYKYFHKYDGPNACATYLAEIGGKMEDRLSEMAKCGVTNLDDYFKKMVALKSAPVAVGSEPVKPRAHLKRTYLIIDEIAQLYARDPSIPKEVLVQARAAVNRIARQGRAAGVHLIVATQKPDATSFDQTVKANLPAVLCFPMATQAASVSALGTKRAFDLNPDIKGRAVWKFGPQTLEVQTYLFQ